MDLVDRDGEVANADSVGVVDAFATVAAAPTMPISPAPVVPMGFSS
jgi:hypothetical protein